MEMDVELTMNFKDYNKPVNIELPAEAASAGDLSSLMTL